MDVHVRQAGQAPVRHVARGTFEMTSHEAAAYDTAAGGPELAETRVREQFLGDIEGEGNARFLLVRLDAGRRSTCGLERIAGSIAGRRGSFVAQHEGISDGSRWHVRWWVVAGSATGDLAGLRGEGFWEHPPGTWTLEYSFDE